MIEVRNIYKQYGSLEVLRGVSLQVKKGEFVIFYPNIGAHAPNKTDSAPHKHRKIVVKVKAQE